ncbi:MAG: peptide ABC transporter substrate-binding protein [Bacilli bacterium]|nr:peptide ABC transporter substrate-binding protein [Bacilli bacterium]
MKIKKMLMGVLSLAMVATVLTGCGSDSSSDNSIVINLGSEPSYVNSVKATGTIDGNVLRHCMEGLVTLDENDEAVAGVAKSWETSEDGKTVTFHLRKDSTWSNGDKVTAKDFVFAFNQLFNLANTADYASTWSPLIVGAQDLLDASKDGLDSDAAKEALKNVGWSAPDDYTFVVQLNNPTTYFVPLMAFVNFYPVHEATWNEYGVDGYATEADKLVYNGAFEITDWTHEDQIVFEKRADYWNADKINLDKITMRMITDTNSILNEYNSGSIDMVGLTGEQAAQLKDEDKEVLQYDDGSNFYMEFNTTIKGLDNKKVRKALTYALDAQKFINNILKNSSTVANNFTPSAILNGSFTEAVGDLMQRDANGATTGADEMPAVKAMFEEGLAEAGITAADLKLVLVADEGDSVQKMCAYVQEQWKKILGINIEIEQMTYKARLQRMSEKDFSVVFAGWGPDYNDPMTFVDLWYTNAGNNHTSWSNAQYDALIDQARAEANADARTQLLIEAEKILADEMPVGYVYCRVRDYAVSERVEGIYRTAFQDINAKFAKIK